MKVRKSSRAFVLNPKNELFLFKFEFAFLADHKTLWVTPGGGLLDGEAFDEALRREMHEELGLILDGFYPWIFYRNKPFTYTTGEEVMSEERYYLIRADNSDIHYGNMDDQERTLTKDGKWWSAEEIRNSSEPFFVDNLAELVVLIANGNIPQEPVQI